MSTEQILVVDDDFGFRRLMETILRGEGYRVDTAASVREAQAAASRRKFDLLISDLKLPDGDGISLLRWWKEQLPETPVIMVTAFGTVQSAVEAMELGAIDYLGKPLSSPDELRLVVRNALEQARSESELEELRRREEELFDCGGVIAEAPPMRNTLSMVQKVAPTSATVLISGESGTGKELIARCIHRNSPRAGKAFVAVNCAALSPTLIESELFGHEKGAFTGAVAQHIGRFERANGGTLFLDEIGELDGNLQAKLLRVLQERIFERVGGMQEITVDVRVIAATNRLLKQAVEEGRFREDLYYRLTTFPLALPPLRERAQDIPLLARHFLKRAATTLGKSEISISDAAMKILVSYPWPGNVREMENLMERLAILCDGAVEPENLPITTTGPARPVLFRDIEKRAILDALEANGGNRTRTARQLGISLRTLQYRLKEYGITVPES